MNFVGRPRAFTRAERILLPHNFRRNISYRIISLINNLLIFMHSNMQNIFAIIILSFTHWILLLSTNNIRWVKKKDLLYILVHKREIIIAWNWFYNLFCMKCLVHHSKACTVFTASSESWMSHRFRFISYEMCACACVWLCLTWYTRRLNLGFRKNMHFITTSRQLKSI